MSFIETKVIKNKKAKYDIQINIIPNLSAFQEEPRKPIIKLKDGLLSADYVFTVPKPDSKNTLVSSMSLPTKPERYLENLDKAAKSVESLRSASLNESQKPKKRNKIGNRGSRISQICSLF